MLLLLEAQPNARPLTSASYNDLREGYKTNTKSRYNAETMDLMSMSVEEVIG